MYQKLPTFKEYLKEELKDKEFLKFYEVEGKKLKFRYKISQLIQKLKLF